MEEGRYTRSGKERLRGGKRRENEALMPIERISYTLRKVILFRGSLIYRYWVKFGPTEGGGLEVLSEGGASGASQ